MNIFNRCTTYELKALEEIGIIIENRNYNEEELKQIAVHVEENIMNQSLKNNDMAKAINKYSTFLNKIYTI